jgi:SAM-dependent methyltransferase
MTTSMDSRAWDERYTGSALLWGAGPNQFLEAEVVDLSPGSALDVACGEGRNAVWLAERGWSVVGVDFSPVALGKAAGLAEARGVTVDWVKADLGTWEPPASYDLVAVLYLHLPAWLRSPLFRRLAGAVSPGGTMLVVGQDLSNLSGGWGGPQDPALLYELDEVAGELAEVLRIERAERAHRPVVTPEGEATAIDTLVRAVRL